MQKGDSSAREGGGRGRGRGGGEGFEAKGGDEFCAEVKKSEAKRA